MPETRKTPSPRRIYRRTTSLRRADRAVRIRAGLTDPKPKPNPHNGTLRGALILTLREALTSPHAPTSHRTPGVYVVGRKEPSAPVRSPRTAQRLAEARRKTPQSFAPTISFQPIPA